MWISSQNGTKRNGEKFGGIRVTIYTLNASIPIGRNI